MKKFIVETYYTCTFKTVHSLNNLNESELANIDKRSDGEVEVIDVKLNNRKTKKIGEKNKSTSVTPKIEKPISDTISQQISKIKKSDDQNNLKVKNKARFKMPDRRKGYIQKAQIEITKFIFILVNMMMGK